MSLHTVHNSELPQRLERARRGPTLWRWALATAGLACFALGAIGAVVPGMPTTIFLLVGSYCFTRSCPWLEDRLLRTRLLRPYAAFLRSNEPMSRRARLTVIGTVWLSIGVSLAILAGGDRLHPWILASSLGLGAVATLSIALFRRRGTANHASNRSGPASPGRSR